MTLTAKQEAFSQAIASGMNQARWYVYELVDPRDGEAFYVGKGCGSRIHAHEKEAKKSGIACSEKHGRIKEIWAAGFDVDLQYVAYFWDESHAYAHEESRVAAYGLESLTNIRPGGGSCRGSFISRPSKPIAPMVYARLMVDCKNLIAWFVKWVAGKESKTGFSASGASHQTMILDVCFSTVFPQAWESIKTSREAVEFVKPHFLTHGVELNCAYH